MIPPGYRPDRNAMFLLIIVLATIGASGAGFTWWDRTPWPIRLTLGNRSDEAGEGFTPDGRSFVVSHSNGPGQTFVFTAYDLTTGAAGPGAIPTSVLNLGARSHDGASRIEEQRGFDPQVGQQMGEALLWRDVATRSIRQRLPISGFKVVCSAFAADDQSFRAVLVRGNSMFVANQPPTRPSRKVMTWNLATGAVVERPITVEFVSPLVFTRDTRTCVDLDQARGGVQIWDLDTSQPRGALIPITGPLAAHFIGFTSPYNSSADDRWLALSYRDGQVAVIDLKKGRLVRTMTLHSPSTWTAQPQFSPDGRLLISSGTSQGAWSLPPWCLRWIQWFLPGYTRRAYSEVVVADVATGQILARAPGAHSPRFSPDGQLILTREDNGKFAVRSTPRPLQP